MHGCRSREYLIDNDSNDGDSDFGDNDENVSDPDDDYSYNSVNF